MQTPPIHDRLADPAAVKAARRNLIDPDEADHLAELLGLLADGTRARILFALGAVDELCVGDIAEALAAKGFDIERRKIQLHEPIKKLGEVTVPVKLHRDVIVPLKVKVVAEGK